WTQSGANRYSLHDPRDGAAELYGRIWMQRRFPVNAAALEQQHHGRAHVEAAQFLALGELMAQPLGDDLRTLATARRRIHFTTVHGLDTANVQRADQDHGDSSDRRRELTNETFITSEHSGHSARRGRVHAEQLTRHINGLERRARVGHVN